MDLPSTVRLFSERPGSRTRAAPELAGSDEENPDIAGHLLFKAYALRTSITTLVEILAKIGAATAPEEIALGLGLSAVGAATAMLVTGVVLVTYVALILSGKSKDISNLEKGSSLLTPEGFATGVAAGAMGKDPIEGAQWGAAAHSLFNISKILNPKAIDAAFNEAMVGVGEFSEFLKEHGSLFQPTNTSGASPLAVDDRPNGIPDFSGILDDRRDENSYPPIPYADPPAINQNNPQDD